MALSGSDPKTKKAVDEAKELDALAAHLLLDAKKYKTDSPIGQFGYLERKPDDPGTGLFTMRENVIKAQQELSKIEAKGSAVLPNVELAYQELHKIQAEYWDNILRGKPQDAKNFQEEQNKKIENCKTALAELGREKPGDAKIKASIEVQLKSLDELPKNIDTDRHNLVEKLTRAKERNFATKAEKKLERKDNIEEKLFSVYRDRSSDEKDIKAKLTEYSGDALLARSLSPDAEEDKVSVGYKEAKQKIVDEMARAEAAGMPYESLFCPFGKKKTDLEYLIRRFRKKEGGEWYLEPRMLKDNKITTPEQFIEMVKAICEFQKFSGADTEVVNLSFSKKAWGDTYVNQRVDQILAAIKYLKDEVIPPKELELDGLAEEALHNCKDRKKAERVWNELAALREAATQARAEYAAEAKKEVLDKKDEIQPKLKEAVDKVEEKLDSKKDAKDNYIFSIKNESDLQNKIDAEKKASPPVAGAVVLGGTQYLTKALIAVANDIIDSKEPGSPVEKFEAVLKNEVDKIKELHASLASTQQTLNEQLEKIGVVFANDPHDPQLVELKDHLNKLEQAERFLYKELKDRCADWNNHKLIKEEVKGYAEDKGAAPEVLDKKEAVKDLLLESENAAGKNVFEKFNKDIGKINRSLTVLEGAIEKNQKGVQHRLNEIESNQAAKAEQYRNLGKT
jgi:hypothetical protein